MRCSAIARRLRWRRCSRERVTHVVRALADELLCDLDGHRAGRFQDHHALDAVLSFAYDPRPHPPNYIIGHGGSTLRAIVSPERIHEHEPEPPHATARTHGAGDAGGEQHRPAPRCRGSKIKTSTRSRRWRRCPDRCRSPASRTATGTRHRATSLRRRLLVRPALPPHRRNRRAP